MINNVKKLTGTMMLEIIIELLKDGGDKCDDCHDNFNF